MVHSTKPDRFYIFLQIQYQILLPKYFSKKTLSTGQLVNISLLKNLFVSLESVISGGVLLGTV